MPLDLNAAAPQRGDLDEAILAFLREELIDAIGEDEYWGVEKVEIETNKPELEVVTEEEARRAYGPGAWEDDGPDAEEAEPRPEPEPQPVPEAGPQQGDARGGAGPRQRYIRTDDIKRAVKGREADVVRALGILWHGGDEHIRCPYSDHPDKHPSWRLADDGTVFCSGNCPRGARPHSIFDALSFMEGIDFEAAKIRIAEILNRTDLIIDPNASARVGSGGVTLEQLAEAKMLSPQKLYGAGMFNLNRGGQNHDKNAIGIPYWDIGEDQRTRPRWLRRRTALTGNDRFRWRSGDVEKHGKAPLYGVWQLAGQKPNLIILCEGETDCVTLWLNGIAALGIPGSPGGWNEARHAPMLDGIEHIVVVIEPDGGGIRLLERLATSSIVPRLRVLCMPAETKDPNALWCRDPDHVAFRSAFWPLLEKADRFDAEKHALSKSAPAQETRRRRNREDSQGEVPDRLRGLPVIEYAGGRLAEATDQAEELLADGDHEIFQRSDFLVRFGLAEEMTAADGDKVKGPRLVRVDTMHLQDRMNRVIDFQKFDAKKGENKSINPPRDVAMALLQRTGLRRYIPVIDGIASAPIWRADGTIVDQPGFDPLTRILYAPTPGVTFYAISPNPTKDQARQALDALCDLISEFPFTKENGDPATGQPSPSRSVALSGLITPMVRRAILTAPFHAYDATEAGSGKSKLCSLASIIARGHAAPVIPGGSALAPEEFEKKISTALIAADAIVVIDNIEGQLNSELLCSATTEAMLFIRVLGLSKNVLVPNNATFFGNGNGLTIVGDLVRRTIHAGLDPKMDRPELRTFEKDDPVLRALRNRPLYVAAVLTVLRAFHVAGRPQGNLVPLGSFEDWSRLVRAALVWLGEDDPCITMERTRLQDPRRRSLAAVLHQWHDAIEAEATAARAVEIAEQRDLSQRDESNGVPLVYPDFREALYLVAGERGTINSVKLGNWLRSRKGKTIDGLRFEQGENARGGIARWKVVRV